MDWLGPPLALEVLLWGRLECRCLRSALALTKASAPSTSCAGGRTPLSSMIFCAASSPGAVRQMGNYRDPEETNSRMSLDLFTTGTAPVVLAWRTVPGEGS